MKVVLDTNVLVSGIGYPAGIPGLIVASWQRGGLDVVLSRHILNEMVRVLPRLPPIAWSAREIQDLADNFLLMADIVDPGLEHDPLLRDKNDQAILGTLRASKAQYLITGDQDLLALAEKYPIITPAAFWSRHGL